MPFPIGYQTDEARAAITLCAIAYQSENDEDFDVIRAAIESKLRHFFADRFTLEWLGISSDYANLIYVARDASTAGRYAIVTRGTDWDFLTDWVDDFDVLHTHDWPTASDPSIYVAQGSWDGLQALLTLTSEADGRSLLQVLADVASPAAPWLELLVTGHSLGGGLATVLGLYLADAQDRWAGGAPVSMKTYTFAAPTAGNRAFADYYDARSALPDASWQAFRVYNEQDLVPFAYADIEGYVDSGVPLSFPVSLAAAGMARVVQAVLDCRGVAYAQVGHATPLDPRALDARSGCRDPARTLDDFKGWVAFEHSSTTYMKLLGAEPGDLVDRSIDLKAPSSARLDSRIAAGPRG